MSTRLTAPSSMLGGALRWFAVLPLLLIACTPSSSAARPPEGASSIDASAHPACACLLVHLTTSAAPTRAIDLATIREQAEKNPTLCAYELLADDPNTARMNMDLRPYLLQAEGAPIDLVMRPGETGAPRVVPVGDEEQLRAACASSS